MTDDPAAAELAAIRDDIAMSSLGPMPTAPRRVVKRHAPRLLAALDAALRHHRPEHLYGNAATEGEPDACPHDPDSALHFEAADGSGEWLCEGKPEGVVCSCTETSDGERIPYPCDELAGILAALTGKGKADA
jgi:hypothetical protein